MQSILSAGCVPSGALLHSTRASASVTPRCGHRPSTRRSTINSDPANSAGRARPRAQATRVQSIESAGSVPQDRNRADRQCRRRFLRDGPPLVCREETRKNKSLSNCALNWSAATEDCLAASEPTFARHDCAASTHLGPAFARIMFGLSKGNVSQASCLKIVLGERVAIKQDLRARLCFWASTPRVFRCL